MPPSDSVANRVITGWPDPGYGQHGPPPSPAAPGSYELREGDELRGTLVSYYTQLRIVTAAATWDLTQQMRARGWYVVAAREGAPVAHVA